MAAAFDGNRQRPGNKPAASIASRKCGGQAEQRPPFANSPLCPRPLPARLLHPEQTQHAASPSLQPPPRQWRPCHSLFTAILARPPERMRSARLSLLTVCCQH
ncbi:hypothetical protein VTN96DRAFT_93 [Rasamsonia emersonii]